ncbi:phenylalanine--tRNA ligase subunit beta [Candidatus Heimdallarchaeota archaeon B3_Heim]|nr:MAG: phenylalanine--tRNA ligase subunit beta [Candidatus Heimdallarchaeota archaeon B3_Heim]
MVSYKISYNDVLSILNLPQGTTVEALDDLFSYAKCEIEEHDLDDDLLKIDCKTSNRPDCWGVEGLTREVKGITGEKSGLPDISAEPSGYVIKVDPRLKTVRPYIGAAIIRGLSFSDFLIKQIMQLQEKVDFSYGRKRKRSSIGIYNLGMVESPIQYDLTPRSTAFVPLGYEKKLTLSQILSQHEKGIEYGDIFPKKGDLPILRDHRGVVLSMPPIINSNDVGRITEETTDVLVEVTGTNLEVVNAVTTIITQALRDRGGKAYSVEIQYPPKYLDTSEIQITPNTEPFELTINPKDIEKYLNLNLKPADMVKLLQKRRFDVVKKKNSLLIKYPPYRVDLLHWVDIAEEIAMAYGYMNIEPTKWKVMTIGHLSKRSISENYVREILSGCALQEVLTFTLTAPEKIADFMGQKQENLKNNVHIANPVSLTYSVLRSRLLPNLLDFLSRNTHNEYPQYIFEVGEVVKKNQKSVITFTKTAAVLTDADISFENAHSILDSLATQLGITIVLEALVDSEFLEGRTAKILHKDKQIGIIGEISPAILEKWQIYMPAVAFEIDLSMIPTLDLPPLSTS